MAGRYLQVVVDLSYLASPPDPMAAKVDKKKHPPPLLLQVKKMVKNAFPSPAVQHVSKWALLNAFIVVTSVAFAYIAHIPCSKLSWFSPCIELTGAAAAKADAFLYGMLWCAAAMAAAAAPALLLPAGRYRRSRRALAYAALAAAAAEHYMYASGAAMAAVAAPALLLPGRWRRSRRARIYAALAAAAAEHYMYASGICVFLDADPGYLYLRIVGSIVTFFFAAGDVLSFLALLLGDE
ncbi:unnamed protein product [Urochloa decumbens]|uniref:Uncharacterized protein n=1 Tax=Urochloa decumbens TaxID=240449 RepID=A0ABC8ZPN8_9POAL